MVPELLFLVGRIIDALERRTLWRSCRFLSLTPQKISRSG